MFLTLLLLFALSEMRFPAALERGTLAEACARLAQEGVPVRYPPELAGVELSGVFPSSYRPTLSELLEALARDTGTSVQEGRVLAPPAMPLPFTFQLAPEWVSEDRGGYVFTRPPYAPAGMDIYLLGTYSFEDQDGYRKIRAEQALKSAQSLRPEATLSDMERVTVDGAEALYYETRPLPNRFWRQWVFFRGQRCYMIVSTCEPRLEVRMKKEVDAMVASFSAR